MWENAERQHQESAVFQPCLTSGHGDQKPSEDILKNLVISSNRFFISFACIIFLHYFYKI